MVKPFPSKTHIGNHMLHPETLMLNYGYDPQLSEGAVKPPVFLTSTFVFRTAEDGQDFFDFVSGRREAPEGMGAGLVYSRFNHPNSEIVEDRVASPLDCRLSSTRTLGSPRPTGRRMPLISISSRSAPARDGTMW